MRKQALERPIAITITGWLFILAGATGFIYHFSEINWVNPFANNAVWIELMRLAAVAGGILTLRGSMAGRWIIVAWMAFHVVVSYFHPLSEFIMHIIILLGVVIVLFYPRPVRS